MFNYISCRALPLQYLGVKMICFIDSCFVNEPIDGQQLFPHLFNTSFLNLECIEIICNKHCLLSTICNAFLDTHRWTNETLEGKIVFNLIERGDDGSSKWKYKWYGTINREEDIDDNASVITAIKLNDMDDIDDDDDNASIATAMETSDLDYFFTGV